jgi:hypothetical protein
MPKSYPRKGGVWNQDPVLMKHFRIIQDFEVKWKSAQDKLESPADMGSAMGGDVENLLNDMLEERGLEGDDFF